MKNKHNSSPKKQNNTNENSSENEVKDRNEENGTEKKEDRSEVGQAEIMEKNNAETANQDTLAKDLEEAKDKYLRIYSEFENFRRRTAREKIEMRIMATRDLMVALLPILDDFERAKESAADPSATKETIGEGMDLIYQKLNKLLQIEGLKKMEIQEGDAFNDDFHEAVTKIPTEEKLEGKIVDVIQPGYFLNEKVIRFAKVVTGDKK